MSARKKKKSGLSKRDGSSAAAVRKHAMTIGISGKIPGMSRAELRRWIRTILYYLNQPQAELSLALVTDPEIHDLNRHYRGKDKPTDVLSFPLADTLHPFLLGDVIIS
ncbi:MAG: rRNA maturation RNase YbeY, partial [Candidatus Binatia bacterium]